MKKEKRIYLSDVIKPEEFKKGRANIVIAPCHSGKTTAAIKKIAPLASCLEKVLYLIDTSAGKESLAKIDEVKKYSEKWLKEISTEWWGTLLSGDGIRVMTYHQFGYQLKKHPDFLKNIEILICDEMHNLIKYKNIEYAKNKKALAKGDSSRTDACKRALLEIARASNEKENVPIVVVMSATINNVSLALNELNVNTHYKNYTNLVDSDKTENTIYYNNFNEVIDCIDPCERVIVYVQTIKMMRKFSELADDGWRNICCLWSINNEEEMDEKQKGVRDAILNTRQIPSEIDMLFINAAYETSINIENADFNTMIIHCGSVDTQVQVRGRLRHDVKYMYVYDPSHEHIACYFPKEYLNRILTKKDIDEIVEKMDFKNHKGRKLKWPSIIKLLRKDGFLVHFTKHNGKKVYEINEL